MEGRRREAHTSNNRDEAGYIGILGRRQVMPRWADDTVWRHVGVGGVGAGGGCSPRKYIRRQEERAGHVK